MLKIESPADLPKLLGYHAMIVLYLLRCAPPGPVQAKYLLDKSGFGNGKITQALRILCSPEFQLAVEVKGGWVINGENAFQLPLGYALPSENHSQSDEAPDIKNHSESDSSIVDGQVVKAGITLGVIPAFENEQKTGKNHSQSDSSQSLESLVKLRDSSLKTDKENLNCLDSTSRNKLLLENAYLLFEKSVTWHTTFSKRSEHDILAWLAHAYTTREKLKRPWGLVYQGLLGKLREKEPDKQYRETPLLYLPEKFLLAVGLVQFTCGICEPKHEFSSEEDLDKHVSQFHCPAEPEIDQAWPEDNSVDAGSQTNYVLDEQIVRAWQHVLDLVKPEMPKASFESWLQDTRPMAWNDESGQLVIGAKSSYARDWLKSRPALINTLKQLLAETLKRDVVDVSFVVKGAVDE